MTFILNRKQLADELGLLQVVAGKSTIPVLSYVRMVVTNGMAQLAATDLDMSLATSLPAAGEGWSGCVPSKQLHELVKLLRDDQVEMQQKDNERIAVKCGRSKHLLPALPVTQFPQVEQPQPATTTMTGSIFATALQRATACVTTDAVEHWMQGVALRSHDGKLYVVASNSRQTAISELESDLQIDVLLPIRSATALVKLLSDADVTFAASANQVVFKQGERTFISRLFDAKFPDWRPLLPDSFKHQVALDPEPTRQAFRLASITAKETALIPIPLRLTLSQSELLVETTESERGHSAEVVAIDCPSLNGNSLTKGINGAHFINFLDSEAKTLMAFNDDMRLVQLSYEGESNYRYITMTLRG